jgi:fluoride ion exporter CrcB/FEX
MREILCVAIGGAIGATSRYKLSALVTRLALTSSFPLGTFL